jgi:Zn finger protein HypA/HybF involved in hydrogenase expression
MIVKYRYAAWGAMLVSHLLSPEEITDDIESVYRNREISIDSADPKRTDFSIPVRKIGRPERVQSMCPHCHGKISDLNNLGYWYGWSFGIEPPYWQELRAFVFERDGFKCEKCGKKFPPALLQAHHRHAKEDGGEDSARNLATMCADCHAENKPIFEG